MALNHNSLLAVRLESESFLQQEQVEIRISICECGQ